MPALICFLVALSVALWHNFTSAGSRCVFFADSQHYLESCQQLATFFRALMEGFPAGSHLDMEKVSGYLMLDGPVLPLVPGVIFALIHKAPSAVTWEPFVVFECLLHAGSAAVVCMLADGLLRSRRWSLLAGVSWGLFPAAIVACGRFLTEIPTALLLLLVIWSASSIFQNRISQSLPLFRRGLVVGLWDGILLLAKPALLPACLLVNALLLPFLNGRKARMLAVLSICAGICLTLIPWAICSKLMTGQVYLTPQRVPVYNVAKGCDTEADGWEALPHSPLTELLTDSPGIMPVISAAWRSHPAEFANLTLRKIVRLWAVPWNDFKANVFFLTPAMQKWWQIMLFLLALPGALAVLCGLPVRWLEEKDRPVALFIGRACLAAIAGHLAYVPFEANARYGYTAMPFVVLLAVYGLFAVTREWRRAPAVIVFLSSCLFLAIWNQIGIVPYLVEVTGDFRSALLLSFAFECFLIGAALASGLLFIRKSGSNKSAVIVSQFFLSMLALLGVALQLAFCLDARADKPWSCAVSPGQSVVRAVRLSSGQLSLLAGNSQAFVLIDGDAASKNAAVRVNGHLVTATPESLLRLYPRRYFLFDIMRTFAAKYQKPVDEFGQWRVVSFPSSWLNADKTNVIAVSNPGREAFTIYGDYSDRWQPRRYLPDFANFSAGELCNQIDGLDGRLLDPVGLPDREANCWLEAGGQKLSDLSPAAGRQSGQYRVLLSIQLPGSERESEAGASSDTTAYVRKLVSSDFDLLIGNTLTDADFRINKLIFKAVSRLDCHIAIPDSVLRYRFLSIKITGSLRSAKGKSIASILPILTGADAPFFSKILASTPPFLNAGAKWSSFQISELVPVSVLPAGVKQLSVALFPGAWEDVWQYGLDGRRDDVCFKDVKVEFKPVQEPEIDVQRLLSY
jgi:hypothetical protein